MQQNCGIKTQCDIKHGRWPTIVNAPCEGGKPPQAVRQGTGGNAKGHLLHAKRPSFTRRKATF